MQNQKVLNIKYTEQTAFLNSTDDKDGAKARIKATDEHFNRPVKVLEKIPEISAQH